MPGPLGRKLVSKQLRSSFLTAFRHLVKSILFVLTDVEVDGRLLAVKLDVRQLGVDDKLLLADTTDDKRL